MKYVVEIPVASERHGEHSILVDADDYELVRSVPWHLKKGARTLYAVTGSRTGMPERNSKHVSMHRFLMPDAETVDHINGNGLDNRRSNLRAANFAQQAHNTRSRGGKSRFKGVFRPTPTSGWIARIVCGGKNFYLGTFPTEVDAALAYNTASARLHGEFACLNDPF